MALTKKDQRWVIYSDIDSERPVEGAQRKILAYSDDMMCVEYHMEVGATTAPHSHPHTQIIYIVDGAFEFVIDGEKKILKKGDSALVKGNLAHSIVCVEKGTTLDFFAPMREDFV